jgi:hypothetical protein
MKLMRKVSLVCFFLLLSFCGFAQTGKDTSIYKNVIKIDLIPFYYDVFDYRQQIRVGLEFERRINPKSSVSCNIDAGMLDKYSFTKYYDFFSQQQGMYSVRRDVTINGFHIMPGYNYYLLRSAKKPLPGITAGGVIDFHYYLKKLDCSNSQTLEATANIYNQKTMGAGISTGAAYGFGTHWFAEIKTCLLVKIFNSVSLQNMESVKPLNAQWTDKKNNFWWFSNIKIGYAFR